MHSSADAVFTKLPKCLNPPTAPSSLNPTGDIGDNPQDAAKSLKEAAFKQKLDVDAARALLKANLSLFVYREALKNIAKSTTDPGVDYFNPFRTGLFDRI